MFEVRVYLEQGDHVLYEDERMLGKPSLEAIETIKLNASDMFERLYDERPSGCRVQIMDCRHPSSLPGADEQKDIFHGLG